MVWIPVVPSGKPYRGHSCCMVLNMAAQMDRVTSIAVKLSMLMILVWNSFQHVESQWKLIQTRYGKFWKIYQSAFIFWATHGLSLDFTQCRCPLAPSPAGPHGMRVPFMALLEIKDLHKQTPYHSGVDLFKTKLHRYQLIWYTEK